LFTQLMALIQKRPITLTVAAVSSTQIRVNVVPQQSENDKKANAAIGHSHAKEVAAIPDEALQGLSTPLCLTGTPEEIDAELVTTLTRFTELHVGLQQSVDNAADSIREACKAIEERERIKKDKGKVPGNAKSTDGKKEEDKKSPEETALPLLFTTQEQPPAAVSAGDKRPATLGAESEQLSEQD
jgi:PRTRC genetic system protein E